MEANYKASFGELPHQYPYYHPTYGMDDRSGVLKSWHDILAEKSLAQQKAMNPATGGAGTAGTSVLVPVYVDPRIVDISRLYTPMVELIPRVSNQGLTADYNRITKKGAAYTANADAALPEVDDEYERKSETIKYLYSVGRVLGPMMPAVPSYTVEQTNPTGAGNVSGNPFANLSAPNALQLEVLLKARALKELEEDLIWNGNATLNSTEFNGIIKQQGSINVSDLETADLVYEDIDNAIALAFADSGRPKLCVGGPNAMNKLRKIMIDTFRYGPSDFSAANPLQFGVPSMFMIHTMVGPVMCIPSQFITDTAGDRQLWFLDTDFIEMRVLQDMTFEELAKTNDSRKFMLKIYECLICRAPEFNAFIDNIA